jgi:site-specific recombinase XerD
MSKALAVRVRGPLSVYQHDFVEHLTVLGYGDDAATLYVRVLGDVSQLLDRRGLSPAVVDEEMVANAFRARLGSGAGGRFPRRVGVILGFLRGRGVSEPPTVSPSTAISALLADYRRFLVVERGLAALTVEGYVACAEWFVAGCRLDTLDAIAKLGAADIARFVTGRSRQRSARSTNEVVVGTRSLLRYFYAKGLIGSPLAQATPWLARGRTSSLPRTVAPGQAHLLVASCDRDTVVGARDIAVLTVLIRLGLRVGEVAAMELHDIDWRRGELMVHSKGGWRDALPLPVDVGDALVGYLEHRGADHGSRHVFLTVQAPRGPLTRTSVRAVVRRACERAGIPDIGGHRLRHGLARDLLRDGAPLHEIGQVLRHRDVETTAVYAKVDFAALSTLARPWPGSAS